MFRMLTAPLQTLAWAAGQCQGTTGAGKLAISDWRKYFYHYNQYQMVQQPFLTSFYPSGPPWPHLTYSVSLLLSFSLILNHFLLSPLYLITFCLFPAQHPCWVVYISFCLLVSLSLNPCLRQAILFYSQRKNLPSILYHVKSICYFQSIILPSFSDPRFYLSIFSSSTRRLSCLVLSASECRDPHWQVFSLS